MTIIAIAIVWYIVGWLCCALLLRNHRKYKPITVADLIYATVLSCIGPVMLLLAAIATKDVWLDKVVIKRKV